MAFRRFLPVRLRVAREPITMLFPDPDVFLIRFRAFTRRARRDVRLRWRTLLYPKEVMLPFPHAASFFDRFFTMFERRARPS